MAISSDKKERLEQAGFRVGSVREFLELTAEESALIELRLTLSAALKQQRTALHLSQSALAGRLQSSQSRVARMEAGDPGVSLDLLIRALLATGVSRETLGRIIAAGPAGSTTSS